MTVRHQAASLAHCHSLTPVTVATASPLKHTQQLEMLARLRAGQRDGRRRQADDDFEGWLKTMVLFLVVSGPKLMKFWEDIGPQSCH